MKKTTPGFDFSITNFILALLLIAMFVPVFALFSSGIQSKFNITGNDSLSHYNQSAELINLSAEIRDGTSFQQDAGVLDVIGGYFSRAVAALKITFLSFDLFTDLTTSAAGDFEYFGFFSNMLTTIILIMLVVGVLIAAYLKWKV